MKHAFNRRNWVVNTSFILHYYATEHESQLWCAVVWRKMASWALSRITNLQKHLNPNNPNSKVLSFFALFLWYENFSWKLRICLLHFFRASLVSSLVYSYWLLVVFVWSFVQGEGIVKISPEISEALSLGKAVVALESTIISHGKMLLFLYEKE